MKIRNLKVEDLDDIFVWRNDPVTRKNSINKNQLSYDEHKAWFRKVLRDKNGKYFIGIKNKEKVGLVSYIKEKKKYRNVSININPKFRGKGYGATLLILSQKSREIISEGSILIAKIKKSNIASFKSFQKAGYIKFSQLKYYYLLSNHINHDRIFKMSKIDNQKKYQKIIDKIESLRSKNNNNWMDILRVAFKHSPKEAAKIMSRIYKEDQRISILAKKLGK